MKKLLVFLIAVFILMETFSVSAFVMHGRGMTLTEPAVGTDVLRLPDYYEDYEDVNVYIPDDRLADSADDEVQEAEELPGQISFAAVGGEPETQDPTDEGTMYMPEILSSMGVLGGMMAALIFSSALKVAT
jgi:hypothetical protein